MIAVEILSLDEVHPVVGIFHITIAHPIERKGCIPRRYMNRLACHWFFKGISQRLTGLYPCLATYHSVEIISGNSFQLIVGQQFDIGFHTHFRSEIAMQFHILCSYRNTLQIPVEECTETEFIWSIRNDRSMTYIRCSRWFRTIQSISDYCRRIRRSHLQLSIFVDHLWRFHTESDTHGIQSVVMLVYHSSIEVCVILLFLGTPTNFRQCTQARENLIFCKTRRELHQLCPKSGLHTNQQLFFFRCELQILVRLITIYSFERNDSSPTMTSFCRSILHVEIQVFSCLHHRRLTFLD